MAENRVKRWREVKRERGMKALTIWFTGEQEGRLKDLAVSWHCSPSEVLQQILDQYQPSTTQRISSPTDKELIRQLIREELQAERAVPAEASPVTDTDTVAPTDASHTQTSRTGSVTPAEPRRRTRTHEVPAPVAASITLDPTKHYLGALCQHGHDYQGTGQSLRNLAAGNCLACKTETQRERRRARREAGTH